MAESRHSPDFRSLMMVYELLYDKLGRLLGDGWRMDTYVSNHPGSKPLYLEILKRHVYMTELSLTHYFTDAKVPADPGASLRIYHDLKTAELVSCVPGLTVAEISAPWVAAEDKFQRRWHMNRFMLKWADYLLDQGHSRATLVFCAESDWPDALKQRACFISDKD